MSKNKVLLKAVSRFCELDGQRVTVSSDEITKDKVEKTKITLSITPEDCYTVKMHALKQHTTVSELLHKWINSHCKTE